MGSRSFWSWPAGWRKAFPWGLLLGLLVVAAVIVVEGLWTGWAALDRLVWVEAVVLYPFVVVGCTAVLAGRQVGRDRDDHAST